MTIIFEGIVPNKVPIACLPNYLSQRVKGLKRHTVSLALARDCIIANPLPTENFFTPGTYLKLWLPFSNYKQLLPWQTSLDVVFEDDNIFLINKPAGMQVHPGLGNPNFTLQNALLANFPNVFDDFSVKWSLPHRIDKGTSGLILVSKNTEAFKFYSANFAERKPIKEYLALVDGVFWDINVAITLHVGRVPNDSYTIAVSENGSFGKLGITHIETIYSKDNKTLFKCIPVTGRTHQIRLHLAHKFNAIIGDLRYGSSQSPQMMLHAYKLEIPLVGKNGMHTFFASLPLYWKDWIKYVC